MAGGAQALLSGEPAAPPPFGSLVFTCNGRGFGLYGEESYDAREATRGPTVAAVHSQPRAVCRTAYSHSHSLFRACHTLRTAARAHVAARGAGTVASYVPGPVVGFLANGEIGRVGAATHLHGFTCATGLLRLTREGAAGGRKAREEQREPPTAAAQ
jgi:hypothetical protein